MTHMTLIRRVAFFCGTLLLAGPFVLPQPVPAQEEVASAMYRYKNREASTGYYEEYEVKPRHQRPFVEIPGLRRGIFAYSPTAARVRIRSRLADSHQGIKFYNRRRCEECHVQETKDLHTVRANLTCRQCHGGEPIAGIDHYYSPLNPFRRHAYVCAKCHEGAGASFATYVVHAPNPSLTGTLKTFPVLFYAFWIMIAIAVGTFVVFLPHTILWGVRELFMKKEKKDREPDDKE
jgi:hypothetical protein